MASVDDLLLHGGDFRRVDLHTQVASVRHHHGIGFGDDRFEIKPQPAVSRILATIRARLFRLSSSAQPGDVFRLPHERQPDIGNRVLRGPPEVLEVLIRDAATESEALGTLIPWCERILPGSFT